MEKKLAAPARAAFFIQRGDVGVGEFSPGLGSGCGWSGCGLLGWFGFGWFCCWFIASFLRPRIAGAYQRTNQCSVAGVQPGLVLP
jgi:hypothetical protein